MAFRQPWVQVKQRIHIALGRIKRQSGIDGSGDLTKDILALPFKIKCLREGMRWRLASMFPVWARRRLLLSMALLIYTSHMLQLLCDSRELSVIRVWISALLSGSQQF